MHQKQYDTSFITITFVMPLKRVLVTLSGGQFVPCVCRFICHVRFLLTSLVVTGAALKELENDKGIIIRYVIGRRFVSVIE